MFFSCFDLVGYFIPSVFFLIREREKNMKLNTYRRIIWEELGEVREYKNILYEIDYIVWTFLKINLN